MWVASHSSADKNGKISLPRLRTCHILAEVFSVRIIVISPSAACAGSVLKRLRCDTRRSLSRISFTCDYIVAGILLFTSLCIVIIKTQELTCGRHDILLCVRIATT